MDLRNMMVQLAQVGDLLDLLHDGEGYMKDNVQRPGLCNWVWDYRGYIQFIQNMFELGAGT